MGILLVEIRASTWAYADEASNTTQSHINPVVRNTKKDAPWDADDDELLNGGVEVAWRRAA
jgi:hypothetical protein